MFKKNKNEFNNLYKLLNARPNIEVPRKNPGLINSLDDALDCFNSLVNSHVFYTGNPLDVKSYIKNNFENTLELAVSNRDDFVIRDISVRLGKILVPKDGGFLYRKKEQYSLSYAFESAINLYLLTKLD